MRRSQPFPLDNNWRSGHGARWAALVILLLAAALRLWDLGGQSLWYDEAYSWWVGIRISPRASLASSLYELVPPLTYFLWRGWAALTGTSAFAMRSSGALAGVVAVAALGATAYRLTRNRRCALAALALAALSPPMVWAARDMRMYGALLAIVALADWALLQVLLGPARQRRRWAWAWGLMALMALYTVVLSAFWLVGQGCLALGVVLTTRRPARRRAIVRALVGPALTAALLYLPWLVPASQGLGQNRGFWPGMLTVDAFLARVVRGITVFRFIAPERVALTAGVAVLAFAVIAPLLARRQVGRALYGPVSTLPALAVAYALLRTVPKWELQHTVIFTPALIVALASAAAPDRHPFASSALRWGNRIGLLGCGALFIAGSLGLLFNPAYANDDWRGAAAYVQAHRRPGEVVIVETGAAAPAWIYYAGDEGLLPMPDDPLLDVDNVLHYENTAAVLNEALARAPGAWVVGWLAEVTDPTSIVETLLDDIGEPSPVPAFHGLTLRHYTLPRAPALPPTPPTTARPEVTLLPDVTLWGVTLPETACPADEPLDIRAWWVASQPDQHTGRFYQATVRISDRHDNIWARTDGPAGAGDFRTEHWPAGSPVLGRYDVVLPPGTPAGVYTATLALYEMGGARSDETVLGAITVGRPRQTPPYPTDLAAVTGSSRAPLTLVGVRLDEETVTPCASLHGWLYWEITSLLVSPLQVRISLGEAEIVTLPTGDLVPAHWEVGDRYLVPFTLPINCRAAHLRAPLHITLLENAVDTGEEVAAWHGPEAEIVVERIFSPPPELTPASVAVGEGLMSLLGYRLEPSAVTAHTPFEITLVWKAGDLTDTPYTVFVHIVPHGAPGPLVAQHDAWPAMGGKPTYTWAPHEIVIDPHPLPELPPGRYDVRIGLYGPDLVRLPLSAIGERLHDDVMVLTTLVVD
jgi:hypothetical protein